jgi:hypothetical protein
MLVYETHKFMALNLIYACTSKSAQTESITKKVNVYLPSLMMKVPDHFNVLGDTYTCHM